MRTKHFVFPGVVFFFCLFSLLEGGIPDASAIPTFSRKYNVSCQQCHTAFPNLTPFGYAFKRNGLRFPGEGTDYDPLEQVAYGEEGPTRVELPKLPPISATALSQFISQPRSGVSNNKAQFQSFGGTLGLLTSGTLGNRFSLWGGLNLSAQYNVATGARTGVVEVERLYGMIMPFQKPFLLFRVGHFEPSVLPISDHRSLMGSYFATSARTIGNNGFTLEGAQHGIEASGILSKGRLGYYLGLVEGTGNRLNVEKDFYGRLEYKLGGLRLDGVGGNSVTTWRDDSLTIGAFGYMGFATVASSLTSQQDRFAIFGSDLGINYWNFLATLGFVRQENNRPVLATPAVSRSTNQVFGEVNYILGRYIPGFRYELFDSATTRDQRLTVGVNVLVKPNIKTFVRGSLLRIAGGSFVDTPEIRAGLMLAL